MWLVFDLTYYDLTVQHFSYNTTSIPLPSTDDKQTFLNIH